MIYFAQSAANQSDLVAKEALKAGANEVRPTSSGVQFSGSLEAGYRFCLTSRVASRLLMALCFDEDVNSPDELYEKALDFAWENWVSPEKTFAITQTIQMCPWLKNGHFAALRVKDAIVDRIRDKFNQERPNIDTENPDITFHVHIRASRVIIYVDFSGEGLYKRGYRSDNLDVSLKEHLAAALLYRTEWYKSVEEGKPGVLLDPFCGTGTIPVEAALMAANIAPGLLRKIPYAFEKFPSFEPETYNKLIDELGDAAEEARDREIKIYASDISRVAVETAKAAALKANVYDLVSFDIKDFTQMEEAPAERGYIVTDPPYGMRVSENTTKLYTLIGQRMQETFRGWKVSILCGDSELLSNIDMKPDRTNSLYNGGILCQLAHYYVFTEEEKEAFIERAKQRKAERLSQPLSSGAEMAYNRIKKNLDQIRPKMEAEGVTCYRIYDADMPEYSAAIDIYEGKWVNLQEYAAPSTIEVETAERRLNELVLATERATGIDLENIYVKQRTQQKGKEQYKKLASSNKFYLVNENELKYLVNFTDYLDTGVFLDHRPIRKFIQENSKGKRFLNLFCYTATASLNAAKGGAINTTSVDASATYLDWAHENFRVNGFSTDFDNFFYKSDVMDFLWDTYDKFDLIFCDPPTFSNSKMRDTFDVQRDHVRLIEACMMHLEKDGLLIFSNNFRRFKMDERILEKFSVEDISKETIGKDFERDMKIHQCYLIRNKVKVEIPAKKIIKIKSE
ncbi:MAG: bifunctional 23S rRNA (guanine(2069)-N(7))-methyltransferase RlmK/23S rRNA (guanine(2445)-N(2))-methyltransferase RlmL [Sphaerochaetaceae bacterium]|nr:bifunctional 23S rRNA (guanine(2069)-N(7))-methyltransferase RlmK/23S rRNA (guanine(2445)-N(2))-methyltransferase RlmL [Sphaerochaetaceae bacterium]